MEFDFEDQKLYSLKDLCLSSIINNGIDYKSIELPKDFEEMLDKKKENPDYFYDKVLRFSSQRHFCHILNKIVHDESLSEYQRFIDIIDVLSTNPETVRRHFPNLKCFVKVLRKKICLFYINYNLERIKKNWEIIFDEPFPDHDQMLDIWFKEKDKKLLESIENINDLSDKHVIRYLYKMGHRHQDGRYYQRVQLQEYLKKVDLL